MNKKEYILGLDMMLGWYYGLNGYYGFKLEDLENLNCKRLELLKEELEILLDEEEEMYEQYEICSYYSC